jgi:H+/Cl- antiporter ClcA
MKKFYHLMVVLVTISIALVLTSIFLMLYIYLGKNASSWANNTLFSLLEHIDYVSLGYIFALNVSFLFIMDTLIVLMLRAWHKGTNKAQAFAERHRLYRYWFNYRKIHLTFILLVIFLTVAIGMPSAVMNTFTAIVSISVLVSNLTKKIGDEERR